MKNILRENIFSRRAILRGIGLSTALAAPAAAASFQAGILPETVSAENGFGIDEHARAVSLALEQQAKLTGAEFFAEIWPARDSSPIWCQKPMREHTSTWSAEKRARYHEWELARHLDQLHGGRWKPVKAIDDDTGLVDMVYFERVRA